MSSVRGWEGEGGWMEDFKASRLVANRGGIVFTIASKECMYRILNNPCKKPRYLYWKYFDGAKSYRNILMVQDVRFRVVQLCSMHRSGLELQGGGGGVE